MWHVLGIIGFYAYIGIGFWLTLRHFPTDFKLAREIKYLAAWPYVLYKGKEEE